MARIHSSVVNLTSKEQENHMKNHILLFPYGEKIIVKVYQGQSVSVKLNRYCWSFFITAVKQSKEEKKSIISEE